MRFNAETQRTHGTSRIGFLFGFLCGFLCVLCVSALKRISRSAMLSTIRIEN